MSWILAGVAGLIWLAKNEATPIILDPRMPAALKQQLLLALQQELPEAKLDALIDVLRRANYTGAAEVFSRRRAAGSSAAATPARLEAVRAFVASEGDPALVEKMGRLLAVAGKPDLARELEQRATALRAQAVAENERSDVLDNLEELLGKADDRRPAAAADDFDEEDEDDDFDEEGEEDENEEDDEDSTVQRMLAAGENPR